MINFFKILRPINLLIILFCIFLSAFIIDNYSFSDIIPIALVITLLAAFANIINDIIDYKIDEVNQLNRPIPSGKISRKSAIMYACMLFLFILLIIAYYEFDYITLKLIFYINLPIIILYTPFLKRIPLLGNLAVAFNLAMVFIVTTIHLNGINSLNIIIPPTVLAFLLMLIREVVKDIADLEGDNQFNITTFPVRFGIQKSFILIILLSIVLIFISLYYYFIIYNHLEYLVSIFIFIIIPLLYYLYEFYKNKTSTYCIYLAKVLKLMTIFGVIVIYLANYLK